MVAPPLCSAIFGVSGSVVLWALVGSLWPFCLGKRFLSVLSWSYCSGGRMDPPLPLPPDLEAFKRLIASSGKRKGGPTQKFVKKVDIPSV